MAEPCIASISPRMSLFREEVLLKIMMWEHLGVPALDCMLRTVSEHQIPKYDRVRLLYFPLRTLLKQSNNEVPVEFESNTPVLKIEQKYS